MMVGLLCCLLERRSSCSGSLGLAARVPSVGETESRTREIHRQNSFDCEENITHADNMDYNNTNPSDAGDQ